MIIIVEMRRVSSLLLDMLGMRSDGYHRQALLEMLRMRSDDYHHPDDCSCRC